MFWLNSNQSTDFQSKSIGCLCCNPVTMIKRFQFKMNQDKHNVTKERILRDGTWLKNIIMPGNKNLDLDTNYITVKNGDVERIDGLYLSLILKLTHPAITC